MSETAVKNPFAPHLPAPADTLVGRQREISLICSHLSAAQRTSVALHGPLGIGKTSLLRHLAHPAVARRHGVGDDALIYLDVHAVSPFTPARFWRRAVRLLARDGVAAQRAALRPAIERFLAEDTPDLIAVETLLDAFHANGRTLTLLLDELEWALQDETPDAARQLLAQLASLLRRSPRVLALVVATERPLSEVARVDGWRGSPFATLFATLPLGPLTREDTDQLLMRAIDGHAVALNADDRARLYALSGGLPVVLQAAAFSVYHARVRGMDERQVWAAAEAAARQAKQPADGLPRSTGAAPAGLWLDEETGDVLVDGQRADDLTALELQVLETLYRTPGRLWPKHDLMTQVWGLEEPVPSDTARVEKLVSRLRRKIEPTPSQPRFLRTVRGRGYRLVQRTS